MKDVLSRDNLIGVPMILEVCNFQLYKCFEYYWVSKNTKRLAYDYLPFANALTVLSIRW